MTTTRNNSPQTPDELLAQELQLLATESWRRARELSGEEHLEWTFPLFVWRYLARQPEVGPNDLQGLDLAYEPISAWEEVSHLLWLNRRLHEEGVPLQWTYHVGLGLEVFDSCYRVRSGRLTLPEHGEPFRGRHSVHVGDVEQGQLVFANSWGEQWGDQGCGYIPRPYFEHHVDSVWVVHPTWLGPSGPMDRALHERAWRRGRPRDVQLGDFLAGYTTPNRTQAKSIEVGDRDGELRKRAVFSARFDLSQIDFIDLSWADRIVGRMHLLYPPNDDRVIVQELFVRPENRRRGAGTALEAVALELAKVNGRTRIELLLHEADASAEGTERAKRFSLQLGYELDENSSRRPNIAARARKRCR